jgi:histidinol phosphatase-like enzyme (inositol monophosphatase family)
MTTDPLGGLDAAEVRNALLDAADAAAAHTLPRFRTMLGVESKETTHFDPVTEADKQAEVAVRTLLAARFPEHGLIGEEMKAKPARSRFTWIIDPIDGTRAFVTGVPVWGTLVGLMVDGEAVAGLMAQPFTGEVFLSLPGAAAYFRGGARVDLKTSAVTELAAAKMTATSPDLFERSGTEAVWNTLRRSVLTTRYGLDCYGYAMLAAGHLDLVVEAGLKDVDICPMIPIIENAGGIVTTWDGQAAEQGGNCVAAATPELHAAAMAVLQG